MAGSISDFKSSFVTDLARPNKFDVSIPIPLTLLPFRNTARNLTFRCENAELPSRTFATLEQKFGSNPTQKFPYQTSYNDVNLTFIVSDDMSEKLFFDAWLEYINPSYKYDFRYRDDYCSTIQINQYDVTNAKSYSINLIDAYPISVNQLDLDWSADGHHKLVVVFAYSYWQNNSIQSLGTSLLQTAISQIVAGFDGLGYADPTPDISLTTVYASVTDEITAAGGNESADVTNGEESGT